jgi:hypothetical protein
MMPGRMFRFFFEVNFLFCRSYGVLLGFLLSAARSLPRFMPWRKIPAKDKF